MWIQLLLGALQGVAEWLPVSSQAVLVLAQVHLLGETDLGALIETALFFHLGTFLAALVYYRTEVARLMRALASWNSTPRSTRKQLRFYIIATLISAVIGFGLLLLIDRVVFDFELAGKVITIGVGVLLLGTAALQLFATNRDERQSQEPTSKDAVIAGIGQGFAALPGVSRSGTTVSLLLLRGMSKRSALALSFVMSLPIVLGGNILLNLNEASFSPENIAGLASAFVFGLLTIHGLVALAERVRFAWFVGFFGVLTLISGIWFM